LESNVNNNFHKIKSSMIKSFDLFMKKVLKLTRNQNRKYQNWKSKADIMVCKPTLAKQVVCVLQFCVKSAMLAHGF